MRKDAHARIPLPPRHISHPAEHRRLLGLLLAATFEEGERRRQLAERGTRAGVAAARSVGDVR